MVASTISSQSPHQQRIISPLIALTRWYLCILVMGSPSLISTGTRRILSSLSSVCPGCEWSYGEGTDGEFNPTGAAGGQEELKPPREVDGGREPKFAGEASGKIEPASNGVKCSCGNIFKYDVVLGSGHWPGGGSMVNGG